MIELRTPAEIEQMRPAGRFVAEVLTRLEEAADVGVNLLELDALAHRMIRERGAESCYIDYHPSFGAMPFGKVLCTSVNDAVLHGLPFDYTLRDGDLLSLDFAVAVDGWVADSAVSVVVGTPDQRDLDLIDTTRRALDAAIEVAQAGNRVGDISAAIGEVARAQGLARQHRSSVATASVAPCTVTRTWPTTVDRGVGSACSRGWSSRSSPGSCTRRTRSSPTPTGGPSAAATGRAALTPSTRSRSPRATRSS